MVWRTKLTVLCLLLLGTGTAECSTGVHCPVCPVGALHPVQGFLERFGAGPGCAARETEERETHVVSVGRASPGSQRQVKVILRPLSFTQPPNRSLALVLSSQNRVQWCLEGENLPPSLSILALVALPSTVQSRGVVCQVKHVGTLPWSPQALLRWSLDQHGAISSLTHAPIANRAYIRLGVDPTMPSVCQLQPLFLSPNYLTSDLQPRGVRGCSPAGAGRDPEVHVIKLQATGSGTRGALQVEVSVSLLPPVASAGWCSVVLILSSTVPVNWALAAKGLRGQISVYSSNSVSPLFPPEPNLTLTVVPSLDLLATHDPLGWANESGFPKVTSYTEADLANRFVIRLAGGGTGSLLSPRSLAVRSQRLPVEMQERSVREWLSRGGDWAGRSQEAMAVQCQDGQLSVAMDSSVLQSLTPPVKAITLRERACEAHSNGTHFLLVFPVISCGTEGVMEAEPRGVLYKNMVLLWRSETSVGVRDETERGSRQTPLVIHFSCFVAIPSPPAVPEVTPFPSALGGPQGSGEGGDGGASGSTVFALQLFGTEEFQDKTTGPCVIMANTRVYVQVSVNGVERGGVEVQSCMVSPLSDPDASPGWAVIQDGCHVDPSLRQIRKGGAMERGGAPPRALRFSFVLKPLYINPVQFLHCRLHYCREGPPGAPPQDRCHGRARLPPLIAQPRSQQCEYRYLLRPMLVTLPLGRAQHAPSSGSEVHTGSVVGVSFAAFLIGIVLMGALWCIYTRTGVTLPLRRGSLQEAVNQTTASWTPPDPLEQSNSFM
ncbi:transforming growth factor beta receptor type 3 [Anguilla anguilla]|uniref:transforming growth factor beta receptor type 3 n=1 Tax=Anguilla anguilla TaxID=7936 RepID=UPI0015A91496|nr:transforming growth factor beta receptor type 3 [Anguilla anguilla]XP_035253080.1 transforming growth factor beta receptor type 3 [Anguilla anguilla]